MPSEELTRVAERYAAMRAQAPETPVDTATSRAGFEAAAPAPPDDLSVTEVSAGGVPADWVCAPGADGQRRLLYLHGGGYVFGSKASHRRLAGDISRASGCAVLVADYRLAPEAVFPAAVEDALAAFTWMRDNGPGGPATAGSTFIAGDSAGGGLTLATMLSAREQGVELPQAAVTLSAWTDLAATGESLQTRSAVDPIFGDGAAIGGAGQLYSGEAGVRDPLVSPLYADFAGLPPMLMQVGDHEILLDDTLRVAERAKAAGVDVTVRVEPEAFHVWQFFAPDAPESVSALAEIGAFLRSHG